MGEHFLTASVFRKGLQMYLQDKKFSDALPSDLYKALQKAVDEAGVNYLLNNLTVEEIFTTWDSNKGFPVVTVSRDYKTGDVTVQQNSRFEDNTTSTKWMIPINFAFSASNNVDFSKTTADFWFTNKSSTINEAFPVDGWLIINKQQTGYYRVNYDLENWERIIQTLNSDNFTSIHVLNRAQLIDDALNLALFKEISWNIPLKLCEYLAREKDYIPFAAFYDAFHYNFLRSFGDEAQAKEFDYFQNHTLANIISSDNTDDTPLKSYLKSVLSGAPKSLGFNPRANDTHLDELHRLKFLQFQKNWL